MSESGKSALRTPHSALLWVALGASLWGTDTVLRKPLAGAVSSLTLVLYEHLLLSVLLLPVFIARRQEWRKLRPLEWLAVIWIAWGGSALGTVFFTMAIFGGDPNVAVLLQKMQPVIAALLAAALLRERLAAGYWLHLGFAVLGALLVSFGSPVRTATVQSPKLPALFAVLAAVLWAGSTVAGRYLSPALSFAGLTALRITIATPLLLLLVLTIGLDLPRLTARQFVTVGWLALVPGLFALLLYYRGLRGTPASRAAIAELCFPATAVLLNWRFLDARVTLAQVAGFLLLWFVVLRMARRPGSAS